MLTLPDVLGTVPQWITAMGLSGLIIAYWRRGVALKGLTNADTADIRVHLTEELERVIERQRACELREESLRERVRVLEDLTEGLYRTIISVSAEKVVELGDDVPPHIRDLAQRTLDAQRSGA